MVGWVIVIDFVRSNGVAPHIFVQLIGRFPRAKKLRVTGHVVCRWLRG